MKKEIDINFFNKGHFSFPHVPENANGEVVLGSFYRFLGLVDTSESEVATNSRNFLKKLKNSTEGTEFDSPSKLDSIDFKYLVEYLLESPRLKNQKDKTVIYLNPLVPSIAALSAVARYPSEGKKGGVPWNPGRYLGEMVARGTSSEEELVERLNLYKDALNVSHDIKSAHCDEVWSRFVDQEIRQIGAINSSDIGKLKGSTINLKNDIPAKRFIEDLASLCDIKSMLSRRKWISLIESYLRLAISVDILWNCHSQIQLENLLECSYSREIKIDEIDTSFSNYEFFEISVSKSNIIENIIDRYVYASHLLDYINKHTQEHMVSIPEEIDSKKIKKWIDEVRGLISYEEYIEIRKDVYHKFDNDESLRRLVRTTKRAGRPNNILEALTYIPGKRNTVEKSKVMYDQGYWYNKHMGKWMFDPGPAALTTMIQICCCYYNAELVSAADLISFLKLYGIKSNEKEITIGSTGKKLRNLGYIVDSPDLEGGILIRRPII